MTTSEEIAVGMGPIRRHIISGPIWAFILEKKWMGTSLTVNSLRQYQHLLHSSSICVRTHTLTLTTGKKKEQLFYISLVRTVAILVLNCEFSFPL